MGTSGKVLIAVRTSTLISDQKFKAPVLPVEDLNILLFIKSLTVGHRRKNTVKQKLKPW